MNTGDQDIMLWESFRKGDKEAFAGLFRQHYESLFRFGSKFTLDHELLEDTIQELFLELWQSKNKPSVSSVKAYLLKSLKYKLLKSFRKKGKVLPLADDGSDVPFVLSHETLLIERQEDVEKKQLVVDAMDKLSNRQKEIIYLKYYQDLSYEEVSEIMNINYQVARNLLYQAIKSLKSMLAGSLELFFLLL